MRPMLFTKNISQAITALRSGGVIVYPTETSYGIGCDATNAESVARVFAMKKRPEGKGVTVLLPVNDMFGDSWVTWSPGLRSCVEQHWPGALNAVCSMKSASSITQQCLTKDTIAIRRSSHPIANALVDALGVPLVSTSANISGEPELYSAQEIFDRFIIEELRPDLIFDAGTLPQHPPSTLIAWGDEKGIVVLRQGEIVVT